MGVLVEVKYFNSFWLKKVCEKPDSVTAGTLLPSWPGLPWNPPGYPKFPYNSNSFAPTDDGGHIGKAYQTPWAVEEMRIKGGFNNTPIDLGVKAYIVEEKNKQEHLKSSLIYSGVLNSRTGINNTNVFSISQDITKSVDPINGSIQRLHAEDTNLIIFQENKVNRALIDKDQIYTTEGGSQTLRPGTVIGQIVPYLGEYGISTNPESFAVFGFQKYFADRNRGCILRLSRDGITEISDYGMDDYFRDNLAVISGDRVDADLVGGTAKIGNIYITPLVPDANPWYGWIDIKFYDGQSCCDISIGSSIYVNGRDTGLFVVDTTSVNGVCRIKINTRDDSVINDNFNTGGEIKFFNKVKSQILGGWDIHNKNYVVSIQDISKIYTNDFIIPKIEQGAGDYSTVTFDEKINGWTSFHHYKPAFIGSLKNRYYSFYDGGLYRHYNTNQNDNSRGLYYSTYDNTTQQWVPDRVKSSISFVFNPSPSVSKNFKTIAYEGSNGWEGEYFSSGFTGKDPMSGVTGTVWVENQDKIQFIYSYDEGLYTTRAGYPARAGFDRKENLYTTNIVSASAPRAGQVISTGMTGIKGYFSTVKLTTDNTTDPGGMKELFSVSSEFVLSSY